MTKSNTNSRNSGFTIIEVLVATSIIGILTSVILSNLNDGRVRAEYSVAKQEMKVLAEATIIMQPQNAALNQVTGSNCSMCSCAAAWGGPPDLRNLPSSDQCAVDWDRALSRIDAASGFINNNRALERDPWGSPYILNENELEYNPPCSFQDSITSAGPDGVFWSSDDFTILIPFHTGTCRGM